MKSNMKENIFMYLVEIDLTVSVLKWKLPSKQKGSSHFAETSYCHHPLWIRTSNPQLQPMYLAESNLFIISRTDQGTDRIQTSIRKLIQLFFDSNPNYKVHPTYLVHTSLDGKTPFYVCLSGEVAPIVRSNSPFRPLKR